MSKQQSNWTSPKSDDIRNFIYGFSLETVNIQMLHIPEGPTPTNMQALFSMSIFIGYSIRDQQWKIMIKNKVYKLPKATGYFGYDGQSTKEMAIKLFKLLLKLEVDKQKKIDKLLGL